VATLTADNLGEYDVFGVVALHGDTVVIGKYRTYTYGGHSSNVYVFERDPHGTEQWLKTADLGDFGTPALAFNGETIMIRQYEYSRGQTFPYSQVHFIQRTSDETAPWRGVEQPVNPLPNFSPYSIREYQSVAIGQELAAVQIGMAPTSLVLLYQQVDNEPNQWVASAVLPSGQHDQIALSARTVVVGQQYSVQGQLRVYDLVASAGGTVTDCSGYGQLGVAGTLADALWSGEQVRFACDGTIETPPLFLLNDTVIHGNDRQVTLDIAGNLVVGLDTSVALDRMTITNRPQLIERSYTILNTGSLTLQESLVRGGGIVNEDELVVINSTIQSEPPASRAISDFRFAPTSSSHTTVSNSTIVGGLGASGVIQLSNTIVTDPNRESVCGGAIQSLGHNLATDDSCGLDQPTDIVSGTANLGPLEDNGGPTWTYALLPGSDALDAGECSGGTITVDQRGVSRPQGAACDIGAFEAEVSDEGAGYLYVSANTWGEVAGIRFADMDILVQDLATGAWAKFFDSKDVGLAGTDVDAFHVMDDGSILISFSQRTHLAGMGWAESEDIVRFVPETLGNNTSGTFAPYLDGSTVGLSTAESNLERIDAIAMTPDGDLVVSIKGAFTVPGIRGRDEDLIRFDASTGTFARYFDGSDVGLTAGSEDVWGAFIGDDGAIYLTTKGDYVVAGSSGSGADIFVCTPSRLGAETVCTFADFWRGAEAGFGDEIADGISWTATLPAVYQSAADLNAADFVMNEAELTTDVDGNDPDEAMVDEATNVADDMADGSEDVTTESGKLFLPLIQK
ncbi:MAG: FG-GAP repeat protein, partial [Caldilineaceae bacterium]|nr:FG-GAP repeat protein [Caldilineaceae bacterium]